MRTAFIESLMELAALDSRIWLLTGDLGYSVVEEFVSRFPERYVNVGVAEQNMTGVAAGLAMAGNIVFTYSIANFPIMRPFEQIRNDVCYHNLNVKIVAVGGGLAYGSLGYSHHALEDLAVTRVLPHMTVVAPGDPHEVRGAVTTLINTPGPAYLRLGKAGEPNIHPHPLELPHGLALEVREGHDLTLFSTGGMLINAIKASDALALINISAAVLSVPYIQPLDKKAILSATLKTGNVITIEEHGLGGLGSAVAEVLALSGLVYRFAMVRTNEKVLKEAGSQEYLRMLSGLSVEHIVNRARVLMGLSET